MTMRYSTTYDSDEEVRTGRGAQARGATATTHGGPPNSTQSGSRRTATKCNQGVSVNAFERMYGYDHDLDLDIVRLAREAAVRYVRDVFKEALA